jgi:hypothetical protein
VRGPQREVDSWLNRLAGMSEQLDWISDYLAASEISANLRIRTRSIAVRAHGSLGQHNILVTRIMPLVAPEGNIFLAAEVPSWLVFLTSTRAE